jgi:ABC-type sugar transport system permease subunit
MGYAAAIAVVMFGLILLTTLINWRLNRGAHV